MDWNAPAVPILYPFLAPASQDVILSLISLDYDDTLMAAAGAQAEEVLTILPLATPGNTFWRWKAIRR